MKSYIVWKKFVEGVRYSVCRFKIGGWGSVFCLAWVFFGVWWWFFGAKVVILGGSTWTRQHLNTAAPEHGSTSQWQHQSAAAPVSGSTWTRQHQSVAAPVSGSTSQRQHQSAAAPVSGSTWRNKTQKNIYKGFNLYKCFYTFVRKLIKLCVGFFI
jgi:hypothetical protein